jgi:predicted nucleotidyltransferase
MASFGSKPAGRSIYSESIRDERDRPEGNIQRLDVPLRDLSNPHISATIGAIQDHSGIACAAITGSLARDRGGDRHSDLDLLIVADAVESVRDVRSWLPEPDHIAIAAVHLVRYFSVLMDDMFKLDLAIYSLEDPPTDWVVQDFDVVKGGPDFERELSSAREATSRRRSAHLSPDVSIDNVLLLLSTAAKRSIRGENLSAHTLISMATDMLICLEVRKGTIPSGTDLLDPRRRLETDNPSLAAVLQGALFAPPQEGIKRLAAHVSGYRDTMQPGQAKVVEHLSSR